MQELFKRIQGVHSMNISEELLNNIILDWKKRDITPTEKSRLLKEYMKECNISERELARRLGISHSTMQDWVSMRQKKKYHESKLFEVKTLVDRLYYILSTRNEPIDNYTLDLMKKLIIVLEEKTKK